MNLCHFAYAAAALGAFVATDVRAQEAPHFRADCKAPMNIVHLDEQLPHLAARLAQEEAVTIVAFGSSSTAGAGASSPEATYPARLEIELKAAFPGVPIRVINRGVGGEDVSEMLARFDRDVAAAKPDLVLWQFGTNALLRDNGIDPEQPLIEEGIRRFKATSTDVVLIDPQYAPKVLNDPDAEPMVNLMANLAHQYHVGLFNRFGLMRYWHETLGMPFERFLSRDLLHLNDYSYGCTARYLGAAIVEAVHETKTPIGVAQHASVHQAVGTH
jgi:acyl-CoA thioesterase I